MLDSIMEIRYHLFKEQIPTEEALQDFTPFEPLSSIKNLHTASLLFLKATFDLYDLAPSPKQLRWFPAGHGLLFSLLSASPERSWNSL